MNLYIPVNTAYNVIHITSRVPQKGKFNNVCDDISEVIETGVAKGQMTHMSFA